MTQHLGPQRAQATLVAAGHVLVHLVAEVRNAYRLLDEAQSSIPGTGDGPGSVGDHSDPTARMAMTPDAARKELDALDALVRRIGRDVLDAERIARCWQPPSVAWRDALATEAASKLGDGEKWCESHLRVNSFERPRTDGSKMCRWCEDVARDIGAGMPPVWLVDKRTRSAKVTTADVDRARREMRTKRKGKRGA